MKSSVVVWEFYFGQDGKRRKSSMSVEFSPATSFKIGPCGSLEIYCLTALRWTYGPGTWFSAHQGDS